MFTKHEINHRFFLKAYPKFPYKDSMSVKGIIIYNLKTKNNSVEEELIQITNLKEHDFISNTGIGSVGYKIFNSPNIEKSDCLLLITKLNPTFANKLDKN